MRRGQPSGKQRREAKRALERLRARREVDQLEVGQRAAELLAETPTARHTDRERRPRAPTPSTSNQREAR